MSPLRPVALFGALNDGGVAYVTIGGIAANAHGVPRSTFDIDIVVERSKANLDRLVAVLDRLDAPETVADAANFLELDPRDSFDLARGRVTRIPTIFGDLDLVADPPGAPRYEELSADALRVEVDGVTIPIVSREHLLVLKRTSGRPKDLADLADLERPL